MKFKLLFLLFFIPFALFCQQQNIFLNYSLKDIVDANTIKDDNSHTSIKPYKHKDVNPIINLDSLSNQFSLLKNIAQFKNNNNKLNAYLLPSASASFGLRDKHYYYNLGIGTHINADITKKFSLAATLFFDNTDYYNHIDSFITLRNVIPNHGIANSTKLGYYYRNFDFYLSYSPAPLFNFEAGKAKNFWGEGYRSLLLSDNAESYPYFKITTTFWKIKYVNLYTRFRNYNASGINEYKERYAAMHYLSWNITPWMNLSLYESVLFRGADTNGRRGFDINYINPVVIYRPVEYSLGSPDNVLIGTNLSFKIKKQNLIYFQLMLDEFYLEHIRNRDGWWANKQAFQVGFKSFNLFGFQYLNFLTEFNYVRPFTYSHLNLLSNYATSNQSLAIPLGANLKEFIATLNYRYSRFFFKVYLNYTDFGSDNAISNYGQDIFKLYQDRSKEFDNFTSQGISNNLLTANLSVSYLIDAYSNLIAECGIYSRTHKNNDYPLKSENYIYIAIKCLFENRYFDF